MPNRPWIVVAALVAMLVAACNEPEPVVGVVTPPPTNTAIPLPTSTTTPTNEPQTLQVRIPIPKATLASPTTSIPVPSNTPTPLPSETPVPLSTDTRLPTNTPRPLPTGTPTPIPANTPAPIVSLVLHAESTVLGYWSDGTADVKVIATLRNEGTLRLEGAQEITAACIAAKDEVDPIGWTGLSHN